MSFFVLFLYRIFHFLHFLFKKAHLSWHHHHTNKDRTGLPWCRFQSTSWYFSECVLVISSSSVVCFLFFVFGCSLSLVLLLLLLRNIICFQKSPFPAILFSLRRNLPWDDKRVAALRRRRRRRKRSGGKVQHLVIVSVLWWFCWRRMHRWLFLFMYSTGPIGWENVRHLSLHVRQIRRHVSSDDRHRFFIENGTLGEFSRRSITTVGYSWPGAISIVNSFVHPRLLGGGDCVRCGE